MCVAFKCVRCWWRLITRMSYLKPNSNKSATTTMMAMNLLPRTQFIWKRVNGTIWICWCRSSILGSGFAHLTHQVNRGCVSHFIVQTDKCVCTGEREREEGRWMFGSGTAFFVYSNNTEFECNVCWNPEYGIAAEVSCNQITAAVDSFSYFYSACAWVSLHHTAPLCVCAIWDIKWRRHNECEWMKVFRFSISADSVERTKTIEKKQQSLNGIYIIHTVACGGHSRHTSLPLRRRPCAYTHFESSPFRVAAATFHDT